VRPDTWHGEGLLKCLGQVATLLCHVSLEKTALKAIQGLAKIRRVLILVQLVRTKNANVNFRTALSVPKLTMEFVLDFPGR
jgi:hypothetical protein